MDNSNVLSEVAILLSTHRARGPKLDKVGSIVANGYGNGDNHVTKLHFTLSCTLEMCLSRSVLR